MKKKAGRVTIHDVAALAQVSIATVSRVMHGTYYVNPEICERVRKAIDELAYVPDSNARSMKFKYRYMIGYLVSDISNRHFTTVSRAIEDVIGPAGYSLIVCSNDSMEGKERENLRALLSHRIDGLIINTSGKNDEYISQIASSMPVVLLHRRISAGDFHGDFVGSDDYAGGALLAEQLLHCGHRTLGLIGSDLSISTFRDRTAGFLDKLAAHGITLPSTHKVSSNYTQEGGYSAMRTLMQQAPEITGLALINNAMAIGAYTWLAERGIRIPDKLSVISFGDIENSSLFFVKPAFISQKPVMIGKAAAALILGRIQDPGLPPRAETIATVLEPGASVRGIP
jgi:LacI family transcriptional regulator